MEILKINPKKLEKEKLMRVVNLIKKGKVVIFPTDTVYGLVADALNQKAVEKVFNLKRRPLKKAIPIFVKNLKMAKKFAKIDKRKEKFLKKVWPGRVTVVLKREKAKIKLYGVEEDKIALRIPNFKLANFVLKELNRPLVGTSANISGKPASGKLEEILRQFKGKRYQPDLIVDAGVLPGRPSRVLDLTTSPPKILRL